MRQAFVAAAFVLTALGLSVPVPAVENLGAHRFGSMDEFQEVIDARCTVCHTRERVDIAIRKRQRLEEIQQKMLERGAVLTERDKSVLGTFWGSPLKEGNAPLPANEAGR